MISERTKKYLKYGALIVGGLVGAYFIYDHIAGASAQQSSADQANAQASAQAAADETQEAELAELGTSGASLESVSGGSEIPVENFSDELSTLLQAAGVEPPSGTASSSQTSGSTPTTGSSVAGSTSSPSTVSTMPVKTVIAGTPRSGLILSPAIRVNATEAAS